MNASYIPNVDHMRVPKPRKAPANMPLNRKETKGSKVTFRRSKVMIGFTDNIQTRSGFLCLTCKLWQTRGPQCSSYGCHGRDPKDRLIEEVSEKVVEEMTTHPPDWEDVGLVGAGLGVGVAVGAGLLVAALGSAVRPR